MAGRDPFVNAGLLLGGTERLIVATGIATIYGRDPLTMSSVWQTLTEAFPDRFLLGLGVSHAPMVEGLRQQEYGKPLTAMREYLDGMDAAPYLAAPPPDDPAPRACSPRSDRRCSSSRATAPTARTRTSSRPSTPRSPARPSGPASGSCPSRWWCSRPIPTEARRIGRAHLAVYLGLPNYVNNLRRLGFTDDDFADGGSDRLVDAIVVWGDEDTIAGPGAASTTTPAPTTSPCRSSRPTPTTVSRSPSGASSRPRSRAELRRHRDAAHRRRRRPRELEDGHRSPSQLDVQHLPRSQPLR